MLSHLNQNPSMVLAVINIVNITTLPSSPLSLPSSSTPEQPALLYVCRASLPLSPSTNIPPASAAQH